MDNNFFQKKEDPIPVESFTEKFRKFLDKSLGIIISISIHLVILACLSFIIFYTSEEKPLFSNINLSEFDIPSLNLKLPENTLVEKLLESSSSTILEETSATPGETSFSENSQKKIFTTDAPSNDLFEFSSESLTAVGFSDGFTSLGDAAMRGSISSGNAFNFRKANRDRNGSAIDSQTNAITLRALKFLKDTQNPDGSWGDFSQYDLSDAISSLTLLTFLAFGEDTATPLFGKTVRLGLQNLLQRARSKENIQRKNDGFGDALLTYVLAEGASVTQIPELLEITHRRIRKILKKLHLQENSWNSGTLSSWNYQALKAAAFAVDDNDLNQLVKKIALQLLQYHRSLGGKFGKQTDLLTRNEVFSRTYCLQLFGYGAHKTTQKYLNYAIRYNRSTMLACDWNSKESWPLYNWYYRTNALFSQAQGQDRHWSRWFRSLVQAMSQHQNSNGSFISPEISGAYNQSGENLATFKSERNLAIYSTALCALMLQTKFRYQESYLNFLKKKKVSLIPDDVGKKIGTDIILQNSFETSVKQ